MQHIHSLASNSIVDLNIILYFKLHYNLQQALCYELVPELV